jgi:hypothetical protein
VAEWHLAQLNVALAKAPLDDPSMVGFTADIGRINAEAEASPGFVWRLDGAYDPPDSEIARDPRVLLTMSVWESVEALYAFVYRSAHRAPFARRAEWFDPVTEASVVLWWITAGSRPSPSEGLARLAHLRRVGPSAHAFTFKRPFPPPGHA